MEYEIEYQAGDWVCEISDDDYSAPHRIMCVSLDGDWVRKLTGAEHGWVLERGKAIIRIAGDHLDIRVSNGTVLPTRVVITARYVHEVQRACRLAHINLW